MLAARVADDDDDAERGGAVGGGVGGGAPAYLGLGGTPEEGPLLIAGTEGGR